MKRQPQRNAFTLVELLVVVAIIIALLAILLPSMGRAITAAHRAVCASNLRQFGTANLSYAADNFAAVMKIHERGNAYPFDIAKTADAAGSWSIERIKKYTLTFEGPSYEIDGTGIAMCPEIDKNLMNDFFRIRNAGHSFVEIQYGYFGGIDRVNPAQVRNGAEKLLVQSRVGGSGRVWMTDILYGDNSDKNGALGGWRYNHGKYGWAFNEYAWMPNQPGQVPFFTGMNRLMGDSAVLWKDAAEFDHVDLMFNSGAYPDPIVGIGDVAFF